MDKLSPARRSQNMAAIKSKDMKPEMLVRRLVHGLGYRYRLHQKDLPGKPDLVFRPRKKVIFVHGCFWHQHCNPKCLDGRKPKSNSNYWGPKLDRNVQRDKSRRKQLTKMGWNVLVVWECETVKLDRLHKRIVDFLDCD
ncbi:very short patch repair protein [bacterium MnTg02]|nr:very short patch repair protein [bacterium MnTg02]